MNEFWKYEEGKNAITDTIVVTSIYNPFWGTAHFGASVSRQGYKIHNAFKGPVYSGNGNVMKNLYEAYVELSKSYSKFIYSDGADTFFVKPLDVPENIIIFSAEKAVWPPTEELKNKWLDYYMTRQDLISSPWKFLNAGNLCGPISLIIEFYERYGLNKYENQDVSGQGEIAHAFFQAIKDGFPIALDIKCELFQTIAFTDPGDFTIINDKICNLRTQTFPAVFHGNGRTDMQWVYDTYKPLDIWL